MSDLPGLARPSAVPRLTLRARMGLAALLIVLLVAVTEGLLWIVAPVPYHEWMVWVPDGNVRGRAEPNQVVHNLAGNPVRINRLGFRGPDYAWKPAPGTLRLIALGGSSTFCFQSSTEETTWPRLLQKYLADRLAMPVEVVNLGLPGYDASNSKVNYLFTGRALHPHAALMYHTWNDMKFFRMLTREPVLYTNLGEYKPLWQKVARATQIGRRVRNILHSLRMTRAETFYTSLEREGTAANEPIAPSALDWARRNYVDFALLARADGVLPVLVTQATLAHPENLENSEIRRHINASDQGMTLPVLCETWQQVNAILRRVANQQDAVFVDGYSAVPADREHLLDHVHLTDAGCAALARVIGETLLQDTRFQTLATRVRNESDNTNVR